jgi:hypothetical protein
MQLWADTKAKQTRNVLRDKAQVWNTSSAKSAVLPPIHARDISLVLCVLQDQQHNKFVYTIVLLLIEREIQRDEGGR